MSLISQKDRKMVIEALEHYVSHMEKTHQSSEKIYSYNTLLNWTRLEWSKHED